MSGSLWLKPPGPEGSWVHVGHAASARRPRPGAAAGTTDTLPVLPRPGRAGAGAGAADPMDELAGRLDAFVASAVHPDEIAAVLESDGLTDEYIRLTYGRPDSFTLAEELYARVPRSFPEPEALPDPWRVSLTACLLRGLIFALPGLAYLLGEPLLEGPPDRLGLPAGTLTLLAGALIGWVWDQTLSTAPTPGSASATAPPPDAPSSSAPRPAPCSAPPPPSPYRAGPRSPTPSPPDRPCTSGPPPSCSSCAGNGCCSPPSAPWPPDRYSRCSPTLPCRCGWPCCWSP